MFAPPAHLGATCSIRTDFAGSEAEGDGTYVLQLATTNLGPDAGGVVVAAALSNHRIKLYRRAGAFALRTIGP